MTEETPDPLKIEFNLNFTEYELGIPEDAINDPRVIEAKRTCWACPEQWEGLLKENYPFYFRYRYGVAQLHVAPPGCDPLEQNPVWVDLIQRQLFDAAAQESRWLWAVAQMESGDDLQGIFPDQKTRDYVFTQLLDYHVQNTFFEDQRLPLVLSSPGDSSGTTTDHSTTDSPLPENAE